jgi:poly-gamma-glutamate capsule biosynthesis protein CapA/YwtB (metallophosphatase superfamily)
VVSVARPMSAVHVATGATPTSARTAVASLTATGVVGTATPTAMTEGTVLVVANTGGVGVYVRRTPSWADKIEAWPDGTRMTVVGLDGAGEGTVWKRVAAPDGVVGWVPVQYLSAVEVAEVATAEPFYLYAPIEQFGAMGATSVDALLEKPGQVISSTDTVDVLFVGDLMLGRSVQARVRAYGGDATRPFWKIADELRQADLTVGNLECALTDSFDLPYDPYTFSLVARTVAADGLGYAGIDAVSLANNHTTEFGGRVLEETMATLRARGIAPFGAGSNLASAHTAAVFEARGLRIALLGYNDIWGGAGATSTGAGLARANDGEIRADIFAARKVADVVIPYFHWGEEYTANPNERQRRLARVAVEAGATAVIGTHAHWVQAVESIEGKPVIYSLGNFVWDMMFEPEVRQGMAAHLLFKDKQLVGIRLMGTRTEDWHQPRWLDRDETRQLGATLVAASRRLSARP